MPDDVHRALRIRGFLLNRDEVPLVGHGAVLMFGREPSVFLPSAFIRILRYEGSAPVPGTRSNLTFDERIEGPLPKQIARAEEVVRGLLRQVTRLDPMTGRFATIPELPRFAWLEAIVNAVAHREGMNRMFAEMADAGLPEPRLRQTDAGFRVTLFNGGETDRAAFQVAVAAVPIDLVPALARLLAGGRITTRQAADLARVSVPTTRRQLQALEASGLVEYIARSSRDPKGYWRWTGSRCEGGQGRDERT